jgi:hypothetical protein
MPHTSNRPKGWRIQEGDRRRPEDTITNGAHIANGFYPSLKTNFVKYADAWQNVWIILYRPRTRMIRYFGIPRIIKVFVYLAIQRKGIETMFKKPTIESRLCIESFAIVLS